ncbi:MAG: DNA mismatch repair endonuclease MutL [Bacteroidales bacterium]|nr:DNA mismatch repair endonuclease MutL [Candidatus Physcousia equi]
MSDIIRLLPDSVANQIAAGEVIQRPASVIKELVENAIDAGAQHVDVLVVDAGRTSIQVIDDGKGMSETDARLAFERHATSKIQKADDLFSLRTMGFRGEALPSIAAVAQVVLRTRTSDQELGTSLRIEGSRVISQEVVASPVGSNFLVQNLFFNVPARRKFLKTNQTELNNIYQEFERMVLVNPGVSFTFSNNGVQTHSLSASTPLQRIVGVFGKRIGGQLLDVHVETNICHIRGFVGKPETARKKTPHQFFFVNGRYMRHPYFHRAVQTAFAGIIAETEQVPYFLYFEVDPADIDVNIHPTKTEIKFENEQFIWPLLIAGIKESLGKYNALPVIDFDTEGMLTDIPVYNPSSASVGEIDAPTIQTDPNYNPFNSPAIEGDGFCIDAQPDEASPEFKTVEMSNHPTEVRPVADFLISPTTPNFEKNASRTNSVLATSHRAGRQGASLHDIQDDSLFFDLASPGSAVKNESTALSVAQLERSDQYFQFQGRFLLSSVKDGLLVINQHRAHMRILYNKYRKHMSAAHCPSQQLLFPSIFQLSASDIVLYEEVHEHLRALGFDITSLGGDSFSIQGVPAGIEGIDPVSLVTEMISSTELSGKPVAEDLQHNIALSMARKAAIPAGQVLSSTEMKALVDELFDGEEATFGPDGKTILAILPLENIEKLFKN